MLDKPRWKERGKLGTGWGQAPQRMRDKLTAGARCIVYGGHRPPESVYSATLQLSSNFGLSGKINAGTRREEDQGVWQVRGWNLYSLDGDIERKFFQGGVGWFMM